jgi:hypothetical protein
MSEFGASSSLMTALSWEPPSSSSADLDIFHSQIFYVFIFLIKFDYLSYFKKIKVIKNQI